MVTWSKLLACPPRLKPRHSGEFQFATGASTCHECGPGFVAQALLPAAPRLISAHSNLLRIPDATYYFFTRGYFRIVGASLPGTREDDCAREELRFGQGAQTCRRRDEYRRCRR